MLLRSSRILLVIIIPALLSVSAFGSEIVLQWADNSDNETGFAVERSLNGKSFKEVARVPTDVTRFVDQSFLAGFLKYYYRVRAFNQYGYSGYTNVGVGELETEPSSEGFLLSTGRSSRETFYAIDSPDQPLVTLRPGPAGPAIQTGQPDFAYLPADGDFQFIVRLDALTADSESSRAGIMVRQSLAADSVRAAISFNHEREIVVHWRASEGATDEVTTHPVDPQTRYLAAVKLGGLLVLAYSDDGRQWTFAEATALDLGDRFLVGLSSTPGATADFEVEKMSNLALQTRQAEDAPNPQPDDWRLPSSAIGSSQNEDGYLYHEASGLHTLTAGTGSDPVQYAYLPTSNRSQIVARILDFNTESLDTRVGVMLRESLEREANFAAIALNKQRQAFALSNTFPQKSLATPSLGAEPFLKLARDGQSCTYSVSADGFSWSSPQGLELDLGNDPLLGLYLDSPSSPLATATLEIVESTEALLPPSLSYYRGSRRQAAIGLPDGRISSVFDEQTRLYELKDKGRGFESYRDQLNFNYWTGEGHCRIVAKIEAFKADGAWARVGLLLRPSLQPNAAQAAITLNGQGKVETLTRSRKGQKVVTRRGPKLPDGCYLSLERRGDTVTYAWSPDGVRWNTFQTVTLSLPSVHHVGLVLGSQNGSSRALVELTGLY